MTRGAPRRSEIYLLLFGFAALVCVGAASLWLTGRSAEFGRAVARTLETKNEITRALSLAQDAETGQRGYLLADDKRYLGPYERAVADVQARIARMTDLLSESPEQQEDFAKLKTVLAVKLDELAETVRLQTEGRKAEALAVVETDRGRDAMRAIRTLVASMTAREDAALAERLAASRRVSTLLLAVVVLGLLVAAALAFGAQLVVRRQTRALAASQIELERANVGLESAVAERTADLVAANEEIQRFAYIVSHDLRAPLVNVMGFTSELDAARKQLKEEIDRLAERQPDLVSQDARTIVDADLPEAIGFIRASTSKMDRLINAILKLSREGRRVVTPESVSIRDVAESIAATLRQQTWAADAEIVVDPATPPIVTDRLAIEQVFQNLIENAVKYLDRSRPGKIVVRGRRVGSRVEYEIEDNGRGIDPKDHERVFELFRRAGAQDQPGEGLGLAFVRASVRRLGGVIRLSSEPKQGSTFHLAFPAVFRPQSDRAAA